MCFGSIKNRWQTTTPSMIEKSIMNSYWKDDHLRFITNLLACLTYVKLLIERKTHLNGTLLTRTNQCYQIHDKQYVTDSKELWS